MSLPDGRSTNESSDTREDSSGSSCINKRPAKRKFDSPSKEIVSVKASKSSEDHTSVEPISNEEPLNKEDATPDTAQSKESTGPSDLSTSGSSRRNTGSESLQGNAALVAEHYNSLEEKGIGRRSQSRIVYMRNFNNWIKSMLIIEYIDKARQGKGHGAPFNALDMCCGKGGDLFKWRKANINHLICTDIAEVSVEQCRTRYDDLKSQNSNNRGYAPVFSAEFIVADCTKDRLREKYTDASLQLDLVSCQFAFHYSFESMERAECMLKNAAECLRAGGYFIGTMPDAYDLVARWQRSDSNKFGNELYNVEFLVEDKTRPPFFGAKYNFHLEGVVDCPEFLVHVPTLKKLASRHGLELVMFERFDDYYKRAKEEGRSLLGKMQALETYPPYHEAPLLGRNPEDYRHAARYMQSSSGHRKIGTLSLPEWEATSLYAVFAFRKMKTTWNAEGKPEYVRS